MGIIIISGVHTIIISILLAQFLVFNEVFAAVIFVFDRHIYNHTSRHTHHRPGIQEPVNIQNSTQCKSVLGKYPTATCVFINKLFEAQWLSKIFKASVEVFIYIIYTHVTATYMINKQHYCYYLIIMLNIIIIKENPISHPADCT